MSSYVNLLNDSEIRLHSAASESKSLKIFGVVTVLALVSYAAMSIISFFGATMKASSLKKSWVKQETAHNLAIANNALNINSNRAKSELSGWAKGRIEGIKLLEAIHRIIPPDIQLTELNMTSLLAGVEGEPLRSRSAQKLSAPERKFTLNIKGMAVAVESEKPVFKLVDDLKADALLKSLGIHVELDEASPTTTTNVRTKEPSNAHRFSITCRFSPRPYQ